MRVRAAPLVFFALLAHPAPAQAAVGDESVGMNVHNGDPTFIDACVDLGVRWVRMDANWFDLEPADNMYNWTALDAAVDRAVAANLNVYLTLAYTPSWVTRHGDTDGSSGNDVPDDAAVWSSFVTDAVTHYRARGVTHFGVWNEANLQGFFEGTVGEYVTTIVLPASSAIRMACNDCKVLGPDLANVGDADDYLENVLAMAPGAFDIITHHSYNQFAETGWRVWSGDSFINMLDQQRFPFTRRSIRQVLDAAGWSGEVWITETGYRADPPGDANAENLQAIYVRRVLEEQLGRAWYTNTFFYEIHDCGVDQAGCTIDGFGLMRATAGMPGTRTFPADFREKPAFLELRSFIMQNPSIVGTTPPAQCGDGIDNDHDGRVDGLDRGCTGVQDDDEADDPPRVEMSAGRATPIVDGDLSDFATGPWITLGPDSWQGTEPLGMDDLEVRAAARWDSSALYFAIEVTDEIHDNVHGPAELWQGDSVQVAFDVGAQGGYAYDMTDDHELNFALAGAGNPVATFYRFQGPPGATDDFGGAIVRAGMTTRYELRIGASALPGVAFQDGTRVRFSFLVNDADGAGRVGWKEWTPGIGTTKAPELFGELVLSMGTVSPPDAGMAGDAQNPQPDASIVEDAAPSADASMTVDAAMAADASTADSGTPGPGPGTGSTDGGCACSTNAPHAPSGADFLALFALAVTSCAARARRGSASRASSSS